MYLVFTRIPGESYRRRFRSLLLYLCDVFRALINSLVYCSLGLFVQCRQQSWQSLRTHKAGGRGGGGCGGEN